MAYQPLSLGSTSMDYFGGVDTSGFASSIGNKSYDFSTKSSSGMGFGAAIIAGSIASAYGSILEGYVRKAQAKVTEAQYNYNAVIAEGKADMIDFAKGISNQRWFKRKGSVLAKSMARMGASGLKPTGSSMAVMVETQRQMEIDHIIDQFNYSQEIRYTKNEAKGLRYKGSQAADQGQLAIAKGYTNAFSSMLTGASKYALYKNPRNRTRTLDMTPEGIIRSSVFDSVRG